jgi:hypothetical protein
MLRFNEAKTKLSGIVQRILDQRRIESEQVSTALAHCII